MPLDGCGHGLTLNAARKVDPTRTLTLRRKYEADMVRRFKAVRRLIVEAVAVNDVFGLADPQPLVTIQNAPPRRAFAFGRSDAKVSAFMRWLNQAAAAGILELQLGTPLRSAGAQSWQAVYLQTAYQAGIQSAASNMRAQGATVEQEWISGAFLRPVHADRAGLIYTRAYNELEGITARMSAEISRTLAQGIAEGRGMRELSRTLADRVDVGIKRARVLTRTEVINAHAEATLNSYTEAGLEGVTIDAEYTTADDNKVCPKCRKLEGNVYKIDEARGIIPVHPNCRCAWNPVVRDPSGVVLR
jgi:SPP1 gp7 family putative phage head morphogenesis protein